MYTVGVIGLGFVGLTTALGLCEKGFNVIGFDIDENKTKQINNNSLPFYEPELKPALERHLGKLFQVKNDLVATICDSQIIFYCVGTPANEDGSSNLSILEKAIHDSLKVIRDESEQSKHRLAEQKNLIKTFVIKSTVPPLTTAKKIRPLIENAGLAAGITIGLCNNPEFLREGHAWNDFINPDRVVIGCEDETSKERLSTLYAKFSVPIHFVTLNEAEFIKYLSNTLLATLISYSNEMAMLASKITNIDISKVFKILHQDKRWYGNPANMTTYVYPGCGFGGYCLPKDTIALYMQAKSFGYQANLLEATLKINEDISQHVVKTVTDQINKNEIIGLLGLSFKPNSDDVRNTPASKIISQLLENKYTNIIAYDPLAKENFRKLFNFSIQYAENLDEIKEKARNIVILTSWEEFKKCANWVTHRVLDFRYYVN